MTLAISAATLFTLALIATIRWAGHRISHALVAFLAGFFIATSPLAPYIRAILSGITRSLRLH